MPLYSIDGKTPGLANDGSVWIAPSAEVIGDARCHANVSIWFGAVIRADNTPIEIGAGTNIQDNAVLHSDPESPLVIGRGVTIGHHAILHGCRIANNVLIGMGAVIMNNARICENSIVGAGSLVTEGKEFPPGSLIIGMPAKAIRELTESELRAILRSAEIYNEKRVLYASRLQKLDR